MHSGSLLPCTPSVSSIITTNPNPKIFSFQTTRNKPHNSSFTCQASSSSSSSLSSITDFDLYDLLGIDSSSDQSHIKLAYRSLQKRCHPDIAGPAGHDMAIILNEAYAVLSDPNSRLKYDKEHAKVAELRGYTGKPIYSVWFGSESEERAVFVDEVKCVGCLKCALLAEKTFAVESVYGRARVVAQWADPENKIQEAIEACPVDCISFVERSNLAALEFLMSKQPRGSVRIGAGNTVGTRVSNIFVDVDKFQSRFHDAMDKASTEQSRASDTQTEARISAIRAIRSISNWLYWQSPNTSQILTRTGKKSNDPNIKKLREAVAARKHAKPIARIPTNCLRDEYWIPSTLVLPRATNEDSSGSTAAPESAPSGDVYETNNEDLTEQKRKERNPVLRGIPVATAIVAAVIVRLQVKEGVSGGGGGLDEHIGGSLLLDIVNSSWLQVILAGVTWYLIGLAFVELVEAIQIKTGIDRE